MTKKILYVLFALFLSLYMLPLVAIAQEDAPPNDDEESDAYEDYECYPDKEPDFFDHYEIKNSACGGSIAEIWDDGCGGLFVRNTIRCEKAQLPNNPTPSVKGSANCMCSANACYPAPTPKNLKDQTLLPKNIFEDPKQDGSIADSNKLKLPVNFGWDDIGQWAQDNSKRACTVESYKYEIAGSNLSYSHVVPSPSVKPVLQDTVTSCTLLPLNNYSWHVKACRDSNATDDCTSWGTDNAFSTSSAPELKTPYDPDWQDKESATTKFPATLEWCPQPNSLRKSYAIKAYENTTNGTLNPLPINDIALPSNETTYSDSSQSKAGFEQFEKRATYSWKIGSCTNPLATQCGIFSQLWSIIPGGELKPPINLLPASSSAVNMTQFLSWDNITFSTRFIVHLQGGDLAQNTFVFFTSQDAQLSLQKIWPKLLLDRIYSWKVAPCGGSADSEDIKDCENEDGTVPWSKLTLFITTGAKPINVKITPTQNNATGIPVTLDWDDMAGAASYHYKIGLVSGVATKSEVTLYYPDLKTGTLYPFEIATCADTLGTVCGSSASGSFTTATLTQPNITTPSVGQKEFDPSTKFSWDTIFSSNFYSYALTFLSPSQTETSASCKTLSEVEKKIIFENSSAIRLRCLGNYTFMVKACIDKDCEDASPTTTQNLTVEKLLAPTGGLAPCDRGNDIKSTPWDERDPCQLKHILLLIRNLVDFALFKLSIVILLLMTVLTGINMFISLGDPSLPGKIKLLWKAVGAGLLIMFLAWVFLNVLLHLIGFNVTFYGNWYEVKI